MYGLLLMNSLNALNALMNINSLFNGVRTSDQISWKRHFQVSCLRTNYHQHDWWFKWVKASILLINSLTQILRSQNLYSLNQRQYYPFWGLINQIIQVNYHSPFKLNFSRNLLDSMEATPIFNSPEMSNHKSRMLK